MTPMEIFRQLFGIVETVTDCQAIVMIYERFVRNEVELEVIKNNIAASASAIRKDP